MTQVLYAISKHRADLFAEKQGWRRTMRGYQDARGDTVIFAQDPQRLRGLEISKLFVLEEGTEKDLVQLGLRVDKTELVRS